MLFGVTRAFRALLTWQVPISAVQDTIMEKFEDMQADTVQFSKPWP